MQRRGSMLIGNHTPSRSRRRRLAPALTAAVALAISIGGTIVGATPATAAVERVKVVVRFDGLGPAADVGQLATQLIGPRGGRVSAVYEHAVQGFAAELPAAAVSGLARNPMVASVTPDQVVSIDATDPEVPIGVDRIEGDLNPAAAPVDVDIAILDTGVVAHSELNLVSAVDCTAYLGLFGCLNGNQSAVHWHATHVAGIAAARDNGVGVEGTAPGARLWSVRVLDSNGSGYMSQLISGIDWVTARAGQIEVANMSLGGAFSDPTFDLAISNSIAAGVVYVVAAGNDGQNAAGFSPANHPGVITVSAIADSDGKPGGTGGSPTCRADQDDTLADFSNFGDVVDIAAPGVCIRSTGLNGGYLTASGTSMATPHVAGVVARQLEARGLDPVSAGDVANVRADLLASAIPQASSCGFGGDVDGSPEPLVFLNAVALGGDGACGASGPVDGAPTIEWIRPAVDDRVSGDLQVAVDASDGEDAGTDLTVEFRAADQPWQPMAAQADGSFEVQWDTRSVSDGPTTLEVQATDTAGNTTSTSRTVVVDNVDNVAPTAAFTVDCSGLTCSFDARGSDDPDGSIVGYAWDFGDGSSGNGIQASHSYAASGAPVVELTVTDDEGATGTTRLTLDVVQPAEMRLGAVTAELAGRRNTDLVATVEVLDASGPVVGATVSGYFVVNGAQVAATSTTGTDGIADLSGGRVRWRDFVTYFCVDGVDKTGQDLTTTLPSCVLVMP